MLDASGQWWGLALRMGKGTLDERIVRDVIVNADFFLAVLRDFLAGAAVVKGGRL